MSRNRRLVFVSVFIILVAIAVFRFAHDTSTPLPISRVTTVVALTRGSGPNQIGDTTNDYKDTENTPNEDIAPHAVDRNGNIFITDTANHLFRVSSDGAVTRFSDCPWAKQTHHLACSGDGGLWVDREADFDSTIEKIDADHRVQFHIDRWAPDKVASPGTGPSSAPPEPPKFNPVGGLFTDRDGNLYSYGRFDFIYKFKPDGSPASKDLLSEYSDDDRARLSPSPDSGESWSHVLSTYVSRAGIVRNCDHGIAYSGPRVAPIMKTLVLETWTNQHPRSTRKIDVKSLDCVSTTWLALCGEDNAGNIYFDYDDRSGNPATQWTGPNAIAVIGPDNQAREVFDLYRFYHDGDNSFTSAPRPTRTDITGAGQITYVAATKSLYVELMAANQYRIDRISIGQ